MHPVNAPTSQVLETVGRRSGPVNQDSIRRRCLVTLVPAHPAIRGSAPGPTPRDRAVTDRVPPVRTPPAPTYHPVRHLVALNSGVTGQVPPTRAHPNRPPLTAPPTGPGRVASRPTARNRHRPDTAPDRITPTLPNRPSGPAPGPADRARPRRNFRRTAKYRGRSPIRVGSHRARLTARGNSRSNNAPAGRRTVPVEEVLPVLHQLVHRDVPASHRAHPRTAPTVAPSLHRNAVRLVPPGARANSRSSNAPPRAGKLHAGPARAPRANSRSSSAPARAPNPMDMPRGGQLPRASSRGNDRPRLVVGSPAPFRDRTGPLEPTDAGKVRPSRRDRARAFPECPPRIPGATDVRQVPDSARVDRLRPARLIDRLSAPRSSPGRRR